MVLVNTHAPHRGRSIMLNPTFFSFFKITQILCLAIACFYFLPLHSQDIQFETEPLIPFERIIYFNNHLQTKVQIEVGYTNYHNIYFGLILKNMENPKTLRFIFSPNTLSQIQFNELLIDSPNGFSTHFTSNEINQIYDFWNAIKSLLPRKVFDLISPLFSRLVNKTEPHQIIINEMNKLYFFDCQNLGELKIGYFTFNNQFIVVNVIVGDIEGHCYGRCMSSCGNDSNSGTYSPYCLNHDLCHRIIGTQWGECSDEFLQASLDYLTSPFCK